MGELQLASSSKRNRNKDIFCKFETK